MPDIMHQYEMMLKHQVGWRGLLTPAVLGAKRQDRSLKGCQIY
jgi:hypothetical protein